jgi:hypothetical protein
VSGHGDRHCPRPPAQRRRRSSTPGCSSWTPARIRLPEGAARKVSASVRRACIRTPTWHRARTGNPGRILIPGDGAAGDQGLRIGLPARQWRLGDACGLSRLMAKPGAASAPRGHAPLKRTHCLWLADLARLARAASRAGFGVGWAARRGPISPLWWYGPFPCSLPPNPACTFQCTGLSSDLCRVRDGVRVDPVMAVGADDKSLAPHLRHEGGPRGLARPGLAELLERGDLVDDHCGAVLA